MSTGPGGDFRPPPGTGFQPAPMNRPPAQPLGIGVQPGTQNVIRARLVIISGASGGLFVYSPTPAAGNLVASIAATAGTDAYGNAYLAGVTIYGSSGGTRLALQMTNAGIIYSSAPSSAGPWTSGASETFDTTNSISIAANGSLTFTAGQGLAHQTRLTLGTLAEPTATSGIDGVVYSLGLKTLVCPGYTGTSSLSNITGLSSAVGIGKYRVHGEIIVSNGGTAQAINLGTAGPAITDMRFNWHILVVANSGASVIGTFSDTSITHTATPSLTASTNYMVIIDGYLNFSAAGTFALQTSAVNAFTISVDSFIDVMPA